MIQDASAGSQDESSEVEEGAEVEASGDEVSPDKDGSVEREAADSLDDIELLRDQAQDNHDKFVRAAAELENYRKRAARDVENARRYGLERLAQALLPVRDSLEAGVASADQADVEALLDGKKATLRLLDAALEHVGIEELDPEGEPFDPSKHEAMTLAPSDTAEPNTVLTVVQKGYAIHDRLLRPARVIVAREPDEDEG